MLNLRGGRKTSILYKWDPQDALRLIERERITIFTGVPTMTMALLECPDFSTTDTSSLFSLGAGGTACPPHLTDLIYSKLPHAYPGTGYGMTETNATCASGTGDAFRLRPGSAGTLSPIVECKTVDENGNDLPAGETGELYVKSPANVQQYWNLPEASASTFIDGWVATGDVGYIDKHGSLQITDRIKDVIKSGGEWISSLELEDIVSRCDGVGEVAAFGIPDRQWGERPMLVIVRTAESKLSVSEIQNAIREQVDKGRLSKWAIPERIEFVDNLPKTSVGKMDKKVIRVKYGNNTA
jgi:acyl-CoA synthetase (AMP-forming)/AMP-acid ligase II